MLKSIDHVNLVVADLEAMTRFYIDVLGLSQTMNVTISGPWIEKVVGLADVEAKVVYLQPAEGPRVELIEYMCPGSARPLGLDKANTPGLRHLAFRVDDIYRAVNALEKVGAVMIGQIQQVPDAQVTYAYGVRKRLVYFCDPEQNLLELCEYR